ncbi:translation initiation factor 2 [Streptomyces sp. NPDC093252]|uniref:translation initiation factor 2 n=1 Tax=Streptomyces sp. NPDC093252 TaxID=3154980 RepID=UPI00343A2F91
MLLAARSAVALYRLLDAATALAGDERVSRYFTLVPGSDFGVDMLSAIERVGGRSVPWAEACSRSYDLILTASPKGDLAHLRGRRVLLPHGAGYNKAIPGEGEGSAGSDSASGLDAVLLSPADGGGSSPIALHAVAHPEQVARIAVADRRAADRAKVVGDPTLERLLASRALRDQYRNALGTGPRTLLALTSTWGPESLLRRHPDLPALLATRLPHDTYQVALIVHPNERSLLGAYELAERLAPALDAGLVLAEPHEEWASVLVAADALLTDHGSAALYYCATQDRPVVGLPRSGSELIPGSPVDGLLRGVPVLVPAAGQPTGGLAGGLERALRSYVPGSGQGAARRAFAHQGQALRRLRSELYALLGLVPPHFSSPPRLLPPPRPAARNPAAFDVHAEVEGDLVRVIRRPLSPDAPGDHLAAEYGVAREGVVRSAGLLYRRGRALAAHSDRKDPSWTAGGWVEYVLSAYPGCRSAVAVVSADVMLFRSRGGEAACYTVRVEPLAEAGRIVRADPAAVASGVHAWFVGGVPRPLAAHSLSCAIGGRSYRVTVRPATGEEVMAPF